jgi:hypothetical protein
LRSKMSVFSTREKKSTSDWKRGEERKEDRESEAWQNKIPKEYLDLDMFIFTNTMQKVLFAEHESALVTSF